MTDQACAPCFRMLIRVQSKTLANGEPNDIGIQNQRLVLAVGFESAVKKGIPVKVLIGGLKRGRTQ